MPQATIADRTPRSLPYRLHRPEQTLLYQIIERHYPKFRDVMALQGKYLPQHVQQEFADYLKCGRLEHGFLRVRCESCHAEHLVAFSCKRRGFYSGRPALHPSGQLKLFKIAPGDLVSQLRGASDGRKCGAVGRRGIT